MGELMLLLPPLTIAGNLFVEHLHLEKLVGDTFDNLVRIIQYIIQIIQILKPVSPRD